MDMTKLPSGWPNGHAWSKVGSLVFAGMAGVCISGGSMVGAWVLMAVALRLVYDL